MKLGFLISFFLCMLVTISCSTSNDFLVIPLCNTQNNINRGREILLIDTIFLKTKVPDTVKYFHKNFDYDLISGDYYGLETAIGIKKIEVFNCGTEYIKTILLEDPVFNGSINGIKLHTKDSIFIIKNDPFTLVLINDVGDVINVWNVGDAPLNWDYSNDYYFSGSNFQKPIVSGNTIYLPITPLDYFYHDDRDNINLFFSYDLKERKWKDFFGAADDFYLTKDRIDLPFDYTVPSITYAFNYILITYPLSSFIFKFNLDGEMTQKICVSSKFITQFSKPPKRESDIQQTINYLRSAPFFGPLHYHSKVNVFSRVCFHEMSLYADDGTLNSLCNRRKSLQILDSYFNLISEEIIDKEYNLYPGQYVVLDDGFLINRICTNNKSEDSENVLSMNNKIQFLESSK